MEAGTAVTSSLKFEEWVSHLYFRYSISSQISIRQRSMMVIGSNHELRNDYVEIE
jgi:hypothetical protein